MARGVTRNKYVIVPRCHDKSSHISLIRTRVNSAENQLKLRAAFVEKFRIHENWIVITRSTYSHILFLSIAE